MVHQKLHIARILLLYQFIPPRLVHRLKPRPFTHNAPLLLVSPTTQRPQLPFLHPSTGAAVSPIFARFPFQKQLSRLLSTERKRYLKYNIKTGLFWGAHAWGLAILFFIIVQAVNSERLERIYPTAREWSLLSRHKFRVACGREEPDENPDGDVDYASQGERYRKLLSRLENPKIDGAGLRPIFEDDQFYVKGAGKTVFDISAKSEAWREGYYGCLMGAGHAAERLDGWVHDITRDIAFPPEVVIGPSNPYPKRITPGAAAPAPMEENCVPVFEDPATYYLKILKTQTFTTRQRIQAVLAYADWLDFKKLPSEAKEMYDLGLQMAVKELPPGTGDIVDVESGVIHNATDQVSSNILLVTTAIGRHQAQVNNLSAALPIFLSVLRARRRLSPAPPSPREIDPPPQSGFGAMIRSLLIEPPYPPIPSSGNEPQLRTPASVCEEAGIMIHIGEIFFASSLGTTESASPNPPSSSSSSSSSQSYLSKAASSFFSFFPFLSTSQPTPAVNPQKSGLSWTRDAMDLAETTLLSTPTDDKEARTKCAECLDAGTENWTKMVGFKLREAHAARMTVAKREPSSEVEGPGQGGNWVWKGAAGDVNRAGVGSGFENGLGYGLGYGLGSGIENENKSETKSGSKSKSKSENESKEERKIIEEESEWIREAALVQHETKRLSRLFIQEGLMQDGRRKESGLMNR